MKTFCFRANFDSSGFKGSIILYRKTMFEPTWINFDVSNLNEPKHSVRYEIHSLPPKANLRLSSNYCDSTESVGELYNPVNLQEDEYPKNGNFVTCSNFTVPGIL